VRSERVKSVDIHPTESWTLAALYSGKVMIWDYETGSVAKSFELSDLPVRCAKFISRKQWIVAASDDMRLRVYNYNTQEKIKDFEAHSDYIRTVEVHPTLPYVLSSSDDMSVKMWDWDKVSQVFVLYPEETENPNCPPSQGKIKINSKLRKTHHLVY